MKTTLIVPKNAMVALLLLLSVAACLPKRNSDPEPDLAGSYQMSRFIDRSAGIDARLPGVVNGRNVSGVVVVTRPGDTRINWQIELTVDGQRTKLQSVPSDIRKASGRDYDVLEDGIRVGSINGTDFSIDITDNNNRQAVAASK